MVALGITLSACGIRFVQHEFEDDHSLKDKVASVRIQSGSGSVTVRHSEGATETTIHRRVQHQRDAKPEGVSHRMEGSVLVLRDCGNNCTVDYEVAVPDKTTKVVGQLGSGDVTIEGVASVELSAGSGHVTARDITGNVRLDAGSGDFTAERIAGEVSASVSSGQLKVTDVKGKATLKNSSGDIVGEGLESDVIADASSGSVTLKLTAQKAVRAEASSGDINITVPGGPYKVTADSGSGDKTVKVPTDPSAPTELNLHTGSGDIIVSAA